MKQTFGALRQFVRAKEPLERCELCSLALGPLHSHLLQPSTRQLICACEACAVLFSDARDAKFKRIPRDVRYLADFHLTDGEWESLIIPISMAFFFYSTPEQKVVALYPSPAGATESLLRLESWDQIAQNNPVLQSMLPDVEALLVNRVGSERQYYVAPMDECFNLVGLIRMKWRGLSGGAEVWQELRLFFDALRTKATDKTNEHQYESK
jgi:hypothetical protein